MQDTFGRTIDYLRISITEACNFRCAYCAPNGRPKPTGPPLTVNEIERIVRAAVGIGITKVRLTGGEPLIRHDIIEIVRTIAAIHGIYDFAMTTNGFRLAELARPLANAGLQRVNVSLDSLRRDRFARIVGVDNGDQISHTSFQAHEVRLFNGQALVIIRAPTRSGVATLTAESEGLTPATLHIEAR